MDKLVGWIFVVIIVSLSIVGCGTPPSNNANNTRPANAALPTTTPTPSPTAPANIVASPDFETTSAVDDISFRLWEGQWHNVYLRNIGSTDLREVRITMTIFGENGDQISMQKYYAFWTKNQEQEFSFETGKSPKNVQKITLKGTSEEGSINLAYTPRNITISVVNEDCAASDFFVDWATQNPSRTKVKIEANSTAKVNVKVGTHKLQSCRAGTNNCGSELTTTFTENSTKHTISRSANCPSR